MLLYAMIGGVRNYKDISVRHYCYLGKIIKINIYLFIENATLSILYVQQFSAFIF